MTVKIGIIGGSGFDNTNMVTNVRDSAVTTRWGEPSSPLREGLVAGTPVVFWPLRPWGRCGRRFRAGCWW